MKKFTLVELLVVISIIGILAGIILPIVAGSNRRALVLQAQTDVAAIKMAIEKYIGENHGKPPVCYPPFVKEVNDEWVCDEDYMDKHGRLTKQGYDVLTQLLSGVDIEYDPSRDNLQESGDQKANDTSPGKHPAWSKVNPRKVAYLDVSQDFAINGMRDPWDNRYVIVFDYETGSTPGEYPSNSSLTGGEDRVALDDKIAHPAIDNKIITQAKLDGMVEKNLSPLLRVPVAIYSLGTNGVEGDNNKENESGDTGGLGSEYDPDFDDINSWSSM